MMTLTPKLLAVAALSLTLITGCLGQGHLASMDHNTERLANEVERDGVEIKRLNENTERMADEIEHDRKYIETLTVQLTKMTQAMESLAKLGNDTVNNLMTKVFRTDSTTPPAKTPDLSDLLTAQPSASPQPSSSPQPSPNPSADAADVFETDDELLNSLPNP